MDEKKQPQEKDLKDLPEKPITDKSASTVKGGVMGPGTQTEDDIYVGVRKK